MISVVIDKRIGYPASEEFYSPDERFPEYPFDHVAKKSNAVYSAVRELLRQAGLDSEHYGTPKWNPLGKWIFPGQTVFVLCNFVYHRRLGESIEQFQSKCTHGSVIRAVIDYIYIAVGPTGRIRFGNAPIQSCVWSRVLNETGGQKVEAFYEMMQAPIESADLRLFVDESSGNLLTTQMDRSAEEASITIDLAQRSLLSTQDADHPRYHSLDYLSDRTEAFHRNGSHKYMLHRHILDSDVVVSIPKLKTHEKVGITCAVKGCVGTIVRKDCLAHHRRGTPRHGGDEFRSDSLGLLACFSSFQDIVEKAPPGTVIGRALRFVRRSLRFLIRRIAPTLNGAWPGNDTCWRMAVDIARLIAHAKSDGRVTAEFQRPHLAFLDGIVGGEGNGPLDPQPVNSGALVFADNPVAMDDAAARLMGYDPSTFPIIREATRLTDLPLFESDDSMPTDFAEFNALNNSFLTTVNGKQIPLENLRDLAGRPYRLPKGWNGFPHSVCEAES